MTTTVTSVTTEIFMGLYSRGVRFHVSCDGEEQTIELYPNRDTAIVHQGHISNVGDSWSAAALLAVEELKQLKPLLPQLKGLDPKLVAAIRSAIDIEFSRDVVRLKEECLAVLVDH